MHREFVTLNGTPIPAVVPMSQLANFFPDGKLVGVKMRNPTSKSRMQMYIPKFTDTTRSQLDLRPQSNGGATEYFFSATSSSAPAPSPQPPRADSIPASAAASANSNSGPSSIAPDLSRQPTQVFAPVVEAREKQQPSVARAPASANPATAAAAAATSAAESEADVDEELIQHDTDIAGAAVEPASRQRSPAPSLQQQQQQPTSADALLSDLYLRGRMPHHSVPPPQQHQQPLGSSSIGQATTRKSAERAAAMAAATSSSRSRSPPDADTQAPAPPRMLAPAPPQPEFAGFSFSKDSPKSNEERPNRAEKQRGKHRKSSSNNQHRGSASSELADKMRDAADIAKSVAVSAFGAAANFVAEALTPHGDRKNGPSDGLRAGISRATSAAERVRDRVTYAARSAVVAATEPLGPATTNNNNNNNHDDDDDDDDNYHNDDDDGHRRDSRTRQSQRQPEQQQQQQQSFIDEVLGKMRANAVNIREEMKTDMQMQEASEAKRLAQQQQQQQRQQRRDEQEDVQQQAGDGPRPASASRGNALSYLRNRGSSPQQQQFLAADAASAALFYSNNRPQPVPAFAASFSSTAGATLPEQRTREFSKAIAAIDVNTDVSSPNNTLNSASVRNTSNLQQPQQEQQQQQKIQRQQQQQQQKQNVPANTAKRVPAENQHHKQRIDQQQQQEQRKKQSEERRVAAAADRRRKQRSDTDDVSTDDNKNVSGDGPPLKRSKRDIKWSRDRADALRLLLAGLVILLGIGLSSVERDSWMVCGTRTLTRALRGNALGAVTPVISDNSDVADAGTHIYVSAKAGLWESCVTAQINISEEGVVLGSWERNVLHALATVRDGSKRSADSALLTQESTPDWVMSTSPTILRAVGFEDALPVYQVCRNNVRDHHECNSSVPFTFVRLRVLTLLTLVAATLLFLFTLVDLSRIDVKMHKFVLIFGVVFIWVLSLSVWILYVDSANIPAVAGSTHAECELEANLREVIASFATATVTVAENATRYRAMEKLRMSEGNRGWHENETALIAAMNKNLSTVPINWLAQRVILLDDCNVSFSLLGWLSSWALFSVVLVIYTLSRLSAYRTYSAQEADSASPFNPMNIFRTVGNMAFPALFGGPPTDDSNNNKSPTLSDDDDEDDEGTFSSDDRPPPIARRDDHTSASHRRRGSDNKRDQSPSRRHRANRLSGDTNMISQTISGAIDFVKSIAAPSSSRGVGKSNSFTFNGDGNSSNRRAIRADDVEDSSDDDGNSAWNRNNTAKDGKSHPHHHRRSSSSGSKGEGGWKQVLLDIVWKTALEKVLPYVLGMRAEKQRAETAKMIRELFPDVPPGVVDVVTNMMLEKTRDYLVNQAQEVGATMR